MNAKRILTSLLVVCIALAGMAGCGNESNAKAHVTFWGWGDPEEVEVFNQLTNTFNELHAGEIHVEYIQKPSDGYSSTTAQALSGRRGPDVAYVGDGDIKQWATLGLLEPLDDYLADSEEIDPDDIWPSAMRRYRLDKATMQSRDTDPLYAVPKDIGPTVIFYNADALKTQGVTIISIDEEQIDAHNRDKGTNYAKLGYNPSTKVFNNRIAMTWEDSVALFQLLTLKDNAGKTTQYGYFTEWWFNYGWSVGGDCIKYNESTKKWEFSLGNTNVIKNAAGEDMPTMREAFTHFVQLSQATNIDVDGNGHYGYAVTPSPDTLGTQSKVGYFTSGKVAMLVDGRFSTVSIRKNASFDWDVAPLPKAAKGVEAGHSGSMGMAINSKSKVKDAAWKFCEFIAGKTGQTEQAKTGFNIPNQKSIANTEVFLQSDQKPKNAEIFLRAAEIQTAGDWWYLSDGKWIEQWAPTLNNEVRNGRMTLTEFFTKVTADTNKALAAYTA